MPFFTLEGISFQSFTEAYLLLNLLQLKFGFESFTSVGYLVRHILVSCFSGFFRYQKNSKRRSTELQKETERQIRQCGELEFDPHGPPVLDRGADALYSSRADSQGGQTFADIDKLLEGIPDGSSMDEDKLRGLQSLLNDDSELKELLADVFDRTASPVSSRRPSITTKS